MSEYPSARQQLQQQQQQQQQAQRHASQSSSHPEHAALQGDADVDVGLDQWAGTSHHGQGAAPEDVTALAEAAVGEEEDEEEDSEVLEEDDANAAFGREPWDAPEGHANYAQGDHVDDPEEEEEEEEEEEKSEEAYDDYEEMLDTDTPSETITWIKWYCSLPGHEFFAEVDEDFIEDDFNLTGLVQVVPFYKEALEMILDVETVDESHKIPDVSIIESSAELLYGLIHQRYITTRRGLQQMLEKFEASHFGACPRVFCPTQAVLPCGRSDLPGLEPVKLYCPNCMDCYQPPSSRFSGVDGAYFGTTFPHLFLQNYRDLEPSPIAIPSGSSRSAQAQPADANAAATAAGVPSSQTSTTSWADGTNGANAAQANALQPVPGGVLDPQLIGSKPPQTRIYTPRVYGFKVSEHAKSGPRMRWMRMKPTSLADLEYEGIHPPPPSAPEASSASTPHVGQGTSAGGPAADGSSLSAAVDGANAAVEEAAQAGPSAVGGRLQASGPG
ncbi:unnamed protein product [Tilletia laevis]|nr:unnamed protein product [Tilletia caries]CAD6945945.1 unnamed protein product [Tilletia controversa]CAD6952533.1 unnamed protein product [Tilletia laevis]CAD6954367.1 unnamed protein product [Tilletia laevis]CAD6968717.1 unnamed protein product [Tilletia controversa]